jgi:hypothetical protein
VTGNRLNEPVTRQGGFGSSVRCSWEKGMAGTSVPFCGCAALREKRGADGGVRCGHRHVEERGGEARAWSRHVDGGWCGGAWQPAGRAADGGGHRSVMCEQGRVAHVGRARRCGPAAERRELVRA